jgi:hypothetical protein|tara:strand:+ start:513 stop:755 length:243 start_codon:yes stop_codon:yes gene_type:complete
METKIKLTKEQLEIHKRNKLFDDTQRNYIKEILKYSDLCIYKKEYDYSIECDRALIECLTIALRRSCEKLDYLEYDKTGE